jgi:hypothetical protein
MGGAYAYVDGWLHTRHRRAFCLALSTGRDVTQDTEYTLRPLVSPELGPLQFQDGMRRASQQWRSLRHSQLAQVIPTPCRPRGSAGADNRLAAQRIKTTTRSSTIHPTVSAILLQSRQTYQTGCDRFRPAKLLLSYLARPRFSHMTAETRDLSVRVVTLRRRPREKSSAALRWLAPVPGHQLVEAANLVVDDPALPTLIPCFKAGAGSEIEATAPMLAGTGVVVGKGGLRRPSWSGCPQDPGL